MSITLRCRGGLQFSLYEKMQKTNECQSPCGVGVVYSVSVIHILCGAIVCQSPCGVGVVYRANLQTRMTALFTRHFTYAFHLLNHLFFNIFSKICQSFLTNLRNKFINFFILSSFLRFLPPFLIFLLPSCKSIKHKSIYYYLLSHLSNQITR